MTTRVTAWSRTSGSGCPRWCSLPVPTAGWTLGPKALLRIAGTPLVQILADAFAVAADPVVVVLGAEAARVTEPERRRHPRRPVRFGQYDTIDQPVVGAELVRRLVAAHRPGGTPSRLRYAGPGHPMIFATRHALAAAAQARADHGARDYLRAHPGIIDRVDCST